jgi:spermidine dehydrogenase
MAGLTDNDQDDKALGLNQQICRRDFMNSIQMASGSMLLGSLTPQQLLGRDDWTGYGGVGDYARSNGNTREVISAGHQIRDNVFPALPQNVIDR